MSLNRHEVNSSACSHKVPTGCCLTTAQECCACIDQRPFAAAYPIHIDGEGIKYHRNRWERYCWRCKDYWNTSFSATPTGLSRIPRLPQPLSSHHHQQYHHRQQNTSAASLSPVHTFMPPLRLTSDLEDLAHESVFPATDIPISGTSERIAQLRSELAGVRTGIQRIVSGLHDLDEPTHSPTPAADGRTPSFTMSTGSQERQPPPSSGPVLTGNLESPAWPGEQSSPPGSLPADRNAPIQHFAQPAPGGQDQMLWLRQRAYLEASAINNTPSNPGTPAHRGRHVRENPFHTASSGAEVERPEYPIPMVSMYERRVADASRPTHHAPPTNARSTAEANQAPMPNPLMNPPVMPQQNPTYFRNVNHARLHPLPNSVRYHFPGAPNVAPLVDISTPNSTAGSTPHRTPRRFSPNARSRRMQNQSAPHRSVGQPDSASPNPRASEADLRGPTRGESEGHALGPNELPGITFLHQRFGYPYIYPGGLARDQHRAGPQNRQSGPETDAEPPLTFDTQDRPPPMEPDDMMLDMSCSICKEHLVDTVILPCGHAVMCNWCADLQVPSRKDDRNMPRDRWAKCPMCRARIKQKVKIFHA